MGIRIENKLIVFESVTMTAIEPTYLGIDKTEIRDYLKEHPMPEDPMYSADDLVNDITQSDGMYTLPEGTKPETLGYIEDLLNALI